MLGRQRVTIKSRVPISESHCMFNYFKLSTIFRQIDLFEATHAQQIGQIQTFDFCKFNIQF